MLNRVKNMIERTHFSLYLGTGLYQLTFGFFANIVVNFLMGVSLIVLYPYINPLLLMIIEIFGWILISFGCFTISFPLIQDRIKQNKYLYYLIQFLLKLSMGLTFLLIPFGIFLGISLHSEIKSSKVKSDYEPNNRSKSGLLYTMFTFIPGFFHIILGLLITSILIPLILEEIDFLFPYINYTLINILNIYGWISLISGLILMICSIWSRALLKLKKSNHIPLFFKFIRVLTIISSGGLLIIYPFGTYFGIALLLEFHKIKKL
jgi:hypothetical protein